MSGCAHHGMRQRRCSGRCRMMRSRLSLAEPTRKTRRSNYKELVEPLGIWRHVNQRSDQPSLFKSIQWAKLHLAISVGRGYSSRSGSALQFLE